MIKYNWVLIYIFDSIKSEKKTGNTFDKIDVSLNIKDRPKPSLLNLSNSDSL